MSATTGDSTFISLIDLYRVFPMGSTTVRAVDGIDMRIAEGSFTVVMGPSGSGKSTLLTLLGGLDRPTSGEIHVAGQRIDTLDENGLALYRRKGVGFIFQSFNLVPSMTALENVAFPMRFAGVPAKERKERAFSLLQQVGLGERAFHRPTELSGGEQQRVAVARSLVNEPALILADEPTGNLDTTSGFRIMEMLAELHAQGRTVFVVTHDPRMRSFATDLIYMIDGHSVSEDDYLAASEGYSHEEH